MLGNDFLHYDGNENKYKPVNIVDSTNNNNNNNNNNMYRYNYQLLKKEEGVNDNINEEHNNEIEGMLLKRNQILGEKK